MLRGLLGERLEYKGITFPDMGCIWLAGAAFAPPGFKKRLGGEEAAPPAARRPQNSSSSPPCPTLPSMSE